MNESIDDAGDSEDAAYYSANVNQKFKYVFFVLIVLNSNR